MIKAAEINRNGRTWPAPQAYWKAALEEIVIKRGTLQLPLKSHGYLLEIICGMAGKAEAVQEKKVEERRQQRDQPEKKEPEPTPEASWEERKASAQDHIKALAASLKPGAKK